MGLETLLILGVLPQLLSATLVIRNNTTPASSSHDPSQSGLASNCDKFHLVTAGDSCVAIQSKYGISADQLATWNPALDAQCNDLLLGYYVCVGAPDACTQASSTQPSSGPSPEQTGIIRTCSKFYKVNSNDSLGIVHTADLCMPDTCTTIASNSGISLADFYAWNPAVGSSCSTLLSDYYVCVGAPSAASTSTKQADTSSTTPTSTMPTSSPSATPTSAKPAPSPTQSGIAKSCTEYYQAASGDTCDSIASKRKITSANFNAWNPAVGTSCKSLFLGYYYCVGTA